MLVCRDERIGTASGGGWRGGRERGSGVRPKSDGAFSLGLKEGHTGAEPRETRLPFSPEEAARIRELMVTPTARLACPRCGGDLSTGLPIAGGGSMTAVWEVRCDACARSMIVLDLPAVGPRTLTPTALSAGASRRLGSVEGTCVLYA